LAKREYISTTGRVRGEDDVLAYHPQQAAPGAGWLSWGIACHGYQKFPIRFVIGKLFLSEILTEMPYLKGFSAKIFR